MKLIEILLKKNNNRKPTILLKNLMNVTGWIVRDDFTFIFFYLHPLKYQSCYNFFLNSCKNINF